MESKSGLALQNYFMQMQKLLQFLFITSTIVCGFLVSCAQVPAASHVTIKDNTQEKLTPPHLLKGDQLNGNVRLVIQINDQTATHLSIYRGKPGKLVLLTERTEINNKKVVVYTDSTIDPGKIMNYVYAARNEKKGSMGSDFSNELPAVVNAHPDNVDYFLAFPSGDKIVLYWDDVAKRNSRYIRYSLARHYGPENSRSPLILLAENLAECSFTDEKAQAGNLYTYVLSLTDKEGNNSEKTYTITTSQGAR